MPITFDKHGNPKPYGPIDLSLKRFIEIFTAIPNKEKRKHLGGLFVKYNDNISRDINPMAWTQLIGGSYTTSKEAPNDIDVVNLIDPNSYEKLVNSDGFTSLRRSKEIYSIDGYAVPVFDESDPRYQILLDYLNYWEKWFGKDRNNREKSLPRIKHI